MNIFRLLSDNLDAYLSGAGTTAILTLASFALALVVGVVVAGFRVSPVPPLRLVGALYVEVIRNTPVLVLVYLFVHGLTKVGILFDYFPSAVLVLGGYTGALVAETVRSGINAVAVGQAEAARSIGLTFPATLARVVLPQALRRVVAPLGGLFVALLKNSAIASFIAVADLTSVAARVNEQTARPFEAFGIAALLYVALAIPSGLAAGWLQRRLAVRR